MKTQPTPHEIALEARKRVGGSTYALAKRLDVRWQTAQEWVKGKRVPNGPHLMKLMEIAGKLLIILSVATVTQAIDIKTVHASMQSDNVNIMRTTRWARSQQRAYLRRD